jgi:DNA-binding response OmpR family regulator
VPAAALGDLPARGVPVIARGPAALLRAALLAGCVDYLRDPWAAEECAARVQAAVSREEPRWTLPGAGARLEGCRVVSPGRETALTWHEARILRALLRFRGSPVPREILAMAVGDARRAHGSRALDAHVSSVRRKLRIRIVCVRGQGYMVP